MTEKDLIIQDLRRENAKLRARVPEWISVDVVESLNDMPTVDAVPVVRCKDCKYRFKNNGHSRDGCPIIDANIWMDGDDFCSYGERKDGDGNG